MGDKFSKYKGRPPEIGYELIDKICNALVRGMYIEGAAAYAGVSKVTIYAWMKRGNKEPDSIYEHFLNAVTQAQGQYEMRELDNIDRCAMGQEAEYMKHPPGTITHRGVDISGTIVCDQRGRPVMLKPGIARSFAASAWRLERKFPDRWGAIQKIETTDLTPSVSVYIPSNGREVESAVPLELEPAEELPLEPEIEIEVPENGTTENNS